MQSLPASHYLLEAELSIRHKQMQERSVQAHQNVRLVRTANTASIVLRRVALVVCVTSRLK